uniref:Uncharacterized protein n=1 Tax=Romanomermis culicivorax TaxID=13658 RepID=A0A915IYX6_ROMCU
MVVADVGAMGGCDVAVGGSKVEDDVAGSTSIGGGGSNRASNTSFDGFFKASICLWILASQCKGLM